MSKFAISVAHTSMVHLDPPIPTPPPSTARPSSMERLMEVCEKVPMASRFSPVLPGPVGVPSPMFTPAKRSAVSAQTLGQAIARHRPDLPPQSVALLVAQSSIETGRFRHCYNFNIGNTKCGAHVPHTYLRNTWEMLSPAQAERAANSPLSHLCRFEPDPSTIDPSDAAARVRVTFQPPHPQTRFRAHPSLDEGVREWLGFIERLSSKHPELADALQTGDPKAYARTLKHAGYFTASSRAYANALSAHLKTVKAELVP